MTAQDARGPVLYFSGVPPYPAAMSPFLASLRRYLRLVERGIELDLPALRGTFRALIDALEDRNQAVSLYHTWRGTLDAWCIDLAGHLLAEGLEPFEIRRAVPVGLIRRMGELSTTGSLALDLELDVLAPPVGAMETWRGTIQPYAAANQLVVENRLTRAGQVALELADGEATRWLLTLEVMQSSGPADRLRVARSLLEFLVSRPAVSLELYEWQFDGGFTAADACGIARLDALDLVDAREFAQHSAYEYITSSPQAISVFEEVLKLPDTPFGVLASALLQDLSGRRLATLGVASPPSAVLITSLQARLVTHEVRNALAPTGYSIETLRKLAREGEQPEVFLTHIDRLDRAIGRVSAFVDRQHEAAALGNPSEAGEPIEPRLFIEEALVEARNGVGAPITAELAPELPFVRGARHQLAMAVLNVVRNGLQAIPAGGHVYVRASKAPSGDLRIVIEDDGPGIPESAVTRIFEPGYSTRRDGQGRGLALTRETLEAWGGHIRHEPRQGGGARFILTLPKAKP
jgi:signal transduction histidine kinase